MQVWLDDEFESRKDNFEGWTHCRWPADVIALLKTGEVTDLSLDHDLGEYHHSHTAPRTGYDVVLWMEEEAVRNPNFQLPRVTVHSRNPVGRKKMILGLHKIEEIITKRSDDGKSDPTVRQAGA